MWNNKIKMVRQACLSFLHSAWWSEIAFSWYFHGSWRKVFFQTCKVSRISGLIPLCAVTKTTCQCTQCSSTACLCASRAPNLLAGQPVPRDWNRDVTFGCPPACCKLLGCVVVRSDVFLQNCICGSQELYSREEGFVTACWWSTEIQHAVVWLGQRAVSANPSYVVLQAFALPRAEPSRLCQRPQPASSSSAWCGASSTMPLCRMLGPCLWNIDEVQGTHFRHYTLAHLFIFYVRTEFDTLWFYICACFH